MGWNKEKSIPTALYRNIQVSDKAERKSPLPLQCLSIQVQNHNIQNCLFIDLHNIYLNTDLYILTYSCTLKNHHSWVGNMNIIFHLLLYFLFSCFHEKRPAVNQSSPASLTSSVLASFRSLLQNTQTNFQVRVIPVSCGFPHVSFQSFHKFSAKGYQSEIKKSEWKTWHRNLWWSWNSFKIVSLFLGWMFCFGQNPIIAESSNKLFY